MKEKPGDILSIFGAVFLIFSPMLHPMVTVGVGVAIVVGLLTYHMLHNRKRSGATCRAEPPATPEESRPKPIDN